jgi:protein-L-isoaspartate(D-aspartate) O-methyltransferase
MLRLIFSLLLSFVLLCLSGCSVATFDNSVRVQNVSDSRDEFTSQRLQMVAQQIRARGIQNQAILEAMSNLPRHRFVDPSVLR